MNAEALEIIDKSEYRRTLGVFLGLFKNFRNIKTIKIQSQDMNINVILQEFLPRMRNIEDFYLDSILERYEERFNILRAYVPELKKLWVNSSIINQAQLFFGEEVEIIGI